MNILKLDKMLSNKYEEYWELEPETLSLDLGVSFTENDYAVLTTLISLHRNPEEFLTYADYFLRFIEVSNLYYPDEYFTHMPTSLELVWALHVLSELVDDVESPMITAVVRYVLNSEGLPPYHPLLARFSNEKLITSDATKAADTYIEAMINDTSRSS